MRKGYGHMVLDHYVGRVRQMHAERAQRLRALTTPEDALAYQSSVRAAIRASFGPQPPRTPLNAQVTGIIERPGYRIEKVLWESRPGFPVTGNLYLPRNLERPAPGVIATCGHSQEGKAEPLYQAFCQRLALAGLAALVYDPVNQGERDQYALLEERAAVAGCTSAHNMMGKQLELVGEFLGLWRAWDGIRALDYLLSRPEVDATRVGVTGNSGGGTMTTWLWPLEERFTMAAPSCFVTTFLHNLENELPADCEQYPPTVLGVGLEMADFLMARAPEPVLMLGQHYDYFDRRGHQEAYEEVRRFYEILGAPENVACFRGPHGHGYYLENQEAMVRFFAHHAHLDDTPPTEAIEPLEAPLLHVTPGGNVIRAGGRPIYELIAERAEELADARQILTPEALRTRLAELLHLPAQRPLPHHRNLRPVEIDERIYGRYAVETEGSIRAILRKLIQQGPEYANSLDVEDVVHLYVPHDAAEKDLAGDSLALALQEQHALYALDVRGLGESAPDEEGSFLAALWRGLYVPRL